MADRAQGIDRPTSDPKGPIPRDDEGSGATAQARPEMSQGRGLHLSKAGSGRLTGEAVSLFRAARGRLIDGVRSRYARRYPETFGLRRFRSILDDYEVANLLDVGGKVPLNYFTYRPNFGDLLSPWLVRQMTGREAVVADRSKPHYAIIGSVISQGTDQSIFWGTGMYGTEDKSEAPKNARFHAVRGPLSQAKLSAEKGFGIQVPEVYGDPGLLLPLYYLPDVRITHEFGVIVRWSERSWAAATYGPGVKLIDFSRSDVEAVIREMLSCRKIISSSLYGLIIADAYGIPTAWLASKSPRGGVFKYYDYFASVGKFRSPRQFDPADEPVTAQRLLQSFDVNGESISFDYRTFLDASPLLTRRRGRSKSSGVECADAGPGLRGKPGVDELLPSLGYFGGIAANFLSICCASPIFRIELSLKGRQTELDLRGVELFKNGRRVPINLENASMEQSSEASSGRQRNPFEYGGIHTRREDGSWWRVTFGPPVDADEVRIYNRRDGWGVRARSLTAEISAGHQTVVQSVDSDDTIEATLTLIRRITSRQLPVSVLDSKSAAADARRDVLADLSRLAGHGSLTESREEQRLLASLLRRHRLQDDELMSTDEWALLGHLLASERARVPATGTSVQSFRFVLNTRAKLDRLTTEVNQAGRVLGTPSAVLSRHGFTDVGALRKNSRKYLGLITRASATLRECGYSAMLAYGTLLGAVREGDFLSHDDDIDMLIPTNASSRDEVEQVLSGLSDQLGPRGWKVSRSNSYTNFHMVELSTGLHVDVFPMQVNGAKTLLHMERMRLREVETSLMLPPRPLTFLGEEFLAPADPEGFLAERYGDWRTPDLYDDWPWALEG